MAGGHASPTWTLPPAVSKEIIRLYADVLRVGRITLNGTEVCWNTNSSTEGQLSSFCESFVRGLAEAAPELASEPAALRFAPYWLCKAVSINYALIEVVLMVKRRVGVLCTIETREDGGSGLVEYSVEVRSGKLLCVSLIWKKADNIVYCDPLTAKRQVKGTLPFLETGFCLPPMEGFAPAYSFQLRLKRSITQKLTSSLSSTLSCGAPDRKVVPMEAISIDEPLRSAHPLETFAELAVPPGSASEAEHSRPRPRRLASGSAEALEEMEALVGYLRVRIVRATGLVQLPHAWPDGHLSSPGDQETEVYATCSVAGRTQQTCQMPMGQSPEWREALHFPLTAQDLRDEVALRLFMYNRHRGLRFWGRAAVPVSSALGVGSPSGDVLQSPAGPDEDTASLCGGGSGRLTACFDGNGGSVLVELELVPEAAAAGEGGQRVGGKLHPARNRREEEVEECIVEVGKPLGVGGLKASELMPLTLPGLNSFRGLDLIHVRGENTSEVKSQGFWCTRPCTRDCG